MDAPPQCSSPAADHCAFDGCKKPVQSKGLCGLATIGREERGYTLTAIRKQRGGALPSRNHETRTHEGMSTSSLTVAGYQNTGM